MLNRFFGQKPQEEPKRDPVVTEERAGGDSVSEKGFNPFKNSLSRTRRLFGRLGDTFKQDNITDELWDELEEALLSADVGPSTTTWLMDHLRQRVAAENMHTGSQVQQALREELVALLGEPSPLRFSQQSPLTVILVIGVNGSGKTTTIAKLANRLTKEGHQVILAAADTFRAAAIDQLKVWGERVGVPVISHGLTGVVITKLDSTAKGGFAFAVADDLGVPIKFIGTGEKVEDLAPFDPQSFVAALFAQD